NVDNAGNLLTGGGFSHTVDFDAGAGTFNLTSNGIASLNLSWLNLNTAPTLSGANNLGAINEDDVNNAGTLVSSLISGLTADANGPLSGIAVTGALTANGSWQYALDG